MYWILAQMSECEERVPLTSDPSVDPHISGVHSSTGTSATSSGALASIMRHIICYVYRSSHASLSCL